MGAGMKSPEFYEELAIDELGAATASSLSEGDQAQRYHVGRAETYALLAIAAATRREQATAPAERDEFR